MRARLVAVASSKTIRAAAAIGTPDDRSYDAEQRTEDEDADDDREAGDIGGLSDDRRLEDLLVLPAGGLGDIVDRRPLLLISESIMFVASAALAAMRSRTRRLRRC